MTAEPFEAMLTGGHPNSLGRTLEVVDSVLAEPARLEDLYACYRSDDAVVRLRTSNAVKRISRQHPEWLVPFIDRLLSEIADLDQASAQWTLAELCLTLKPFMDAVQQAHALAVLQRNLAQHTDWIVLNTTMQVLADWEPADAGLRQWLRPHFERLSGDSRGSVARRAAKLLASLTRRINGTQMNTEQHG